MKKTKQSISRRNFLKNSASIASAFTIVAPHVLGRKASAAPSDRLNLAIIGAGGRGGDTLGEFEDENIVALCDVDDKRAEKAFVRFEKAPKYKDFRVMLDKQTDIDAVTVSTPDHTHAVIAMAAIDRNKHVYVEKPLAHTIHEVRALTKAANEKKVITQMGNQGHSFDEIRKVCEWVWDGAIGPIHEVQAWFTRPYGDGKARPTDTPPVPETLNWDLWLGPAADRPYNPAYIPGIWRSWFDFGTGVLGDWVCHILDPAFWALKLGAPQFVTARNGEGEFSPERFPLQSTIEYEFPARENLPPVKVIWTFGKEMDIPQLKGVELDDWNSKAGAILIGEKGSIVHGSHGGGNPRIIPESRRKEYQDPPQTIPRIKGGHQRDWIRCCKEGKEAGSNFTTGGPLAELALLGVIAGTRNGEKLEWDSANTKFKNSEMANRLLQSDYRQGWTL